LEFFSLICGDRGSVEAHLQFWICSALRPEVELHEDPVKSSFAGRFKGLGHLDMQTKHLESSLQFNTDFYFVKNEQKNACQFALDSRPLLPQTLGDPFRRALALSYTASILPYREVFGDISLKLSPEDSAN
jgi:hypothetical protein